MSVVGLSGGQGTVAHDPTQIQCPLKREREREGILKYTGHLTHLPSNTFAICNRALYPNPSTHPHVLIIQPPVLAESKRERKIDISELIRGTSSQVLTCWHHFASLLEHISHASDQSSI